MADITVNYTGKFAKIDTDIKSTDSYLFDALNGRQGDNGRRVYIRFLDNGFPHDLTGETVELQGKDAKGMTKTTQSMEHVFSAKAGTCSFLVPGAFYQVAGPYQSAYFVIRKESTEQAVSTIPVSFSVLENAVFMTTGELTPYLSNVDGKIDTISKRIASITETYNTTLDTIDSGVNSIGKQVADYMKQLQSGKVATTDGSNSFTGSNHFSNLIVDNLSGAGVDNIKSYVDNEVKAGIGSIKLPQSVQISPVSRDITFSDGASKSSASDSLMVWKETYPGVTKIYGVGKVHVDKLGDGDHFHIGLPWNVQAGAFVVGESYTSQLTKVETDNEGGISVFIWGGITNTDVWIDFEIAQVGG